MALSAGDLVRLLLVISSRRCRCCCCYFPAVLDAFYTYTIKTTQMTITIKWQVYQYKCDWRLSELFDFSLWEKTSAKYCVHKRSGSEWNTSGYVYKSHGPVRVIRPEEKRSDPPGLSFCSWLADTVILISFSSINHTYIIYNGSLT